MAKTRKSIRSQKKKALSPFKDYWSKENYYLIGLGFLILIIGFILMAQGSWNNPLSLTISPIVLLIAYLIVFPIAILYRKKKHNNNQNVSS